MALAMVNRHGLIAGATGTGKTKSLQLMAGQLSDAGVPVFISDIKGDVTGIAAPGDATDPRLQARVASLGMTYRPEAHPVEFLSLSGQLGATVRASLHSFGPLLLSKVMELNDTQSAVLTLVFRYCDDNQLPLLDLADLRTTLQYLGSDAGKAALADYGGMSDATLGVLLRDLITLEASGAAKFFGEPEFDVMDLMRTTPDGKGIVSVLELSDVMEQPQLFSTFMLWMLAQLYHVLPEMGDLPKPKLAFFFDEAHLLFDAGVQAPPGPDRADRAAHPLQGRGRVLLDPGADRRAGRRPGPAGQPRAARPARVHAQRRRRPAQGVADLPQQHLLSAGRPGHHVARDRRGARHRALPPAACPRRSQRPAWRRPDSRMGALDAATFQGLVAAGSLRAKYGTTVDPQSAHEIITARIQQAQARGPAGGRRADRRRPRPPARPTPRACRPNAPGRPPSGPSRPRRGPSRPRRERPPRPRRQPSASASDRSTRASGPRAGS